MAPIGFGIISFAHGHSQVYCQRMLQYDDVRLVACWDDDSDPRPQSCGSLWNDLHTRAG